MIYLGKFVIGSKIVRRNNGKLGEFHFNYSKTPFTIGFSENTVGVMHELWIGWVIVWVDYYYQKKDILPYSDKSFEDYIKELSEK